MLLRVQSRGSPRCFPVPVTGTGLAQPIVLEPFAFPSRTSLETWGGPKIGLVWGLPRSLKGSS